MEQKNAVHAFDYNSAESEPIWIKSGVLRAHCWGLALEDAETIHKISSWIA